MDKKIWPIVSVCLLLFAATSLFAQQDNSKKSQIHLSVWDPIGTHGKGAKEYTNTFSFNLLVGRSAAEEAFTLSGLGSLVEGDARGLQISGLVNVAGEDASGLQISGLANIAGGSLSGLQISGLANVAGENASGLQISGLANVSGETAHGLQIAGIVNRASFVEGMQIAGIYNRAKKVKGVQLGVVNIAESGDYPIGLVNLIQDGEKGIALTFDELQNLTATFRSGGRILYGIVGLGYNFKSSKPLMTFESGLGAHLNCTKNFRINTELTQTTMIRRFE